MTRPLSLIKMLSALVLLVLISAACNRPQYGNNEIFSRYEGEKGVFIMQIPPALFISLAEKNETAPGELKEAGKIDMVKVMVYNKPQPEGKTVAEIEAEVKEMVEKFGYEVMMSMTGDKTVIYVYMLESGEFISDLLVMAMEGDSSMTLIGLSGELNEEALIKLTSQSNIKSLAPGHLVPW